MMRRADHGLGTAAAILILVEVDADARVRPFPCRDLHRVQDPVLQGVDAGVSLCDTGGGSAGTPAVDQRDEATSAHLSAVYVMAGQQQERGGKG